MALFKKHPYVCGGCGKAVEAKGNVTSMRDPVSPPPGWLDVTITAQHPVMGAIATLSIMCCSMPCAKKLSQGEGAGIPLMEKFKSAFAEKATHETAPAFDAPEVKP